MSCVLRPTVAKWDVFQSKVSFLSMLVLWVNKLKWPGRARPIFLVISGGSMSHLATPEQSWAKCRLREACTSSLTSAALPAAP